MNNEWERIRTEALGENRGNIQAFAWKGREDHEQPVITWCRTRSKQARTEYESRTLPLIQPAWYYYSGGSSVGSVDQST